MRAITKVGLVGLVVTSLACGGGGGAVVNTYAGTWSGTGTWRTYDASGNPTGSEATALPVDGVVGADGSVDIDIHFPDQIAGFHDSMRGSVTELGAASGLYLDAVTPTSAGNSFTYNATFARTGNQLTITYRAEYGGTAGSARGILTLSQ